MTPTQLKEFRTRRGWGQREMAARIGKSANAILQYEQDGAEVPRTVALAVLAYEFNDAVEQAQQDDSRLYEVRATFAEETK